MEEASTKENIIKKLILEEKQQTSYKWDEMYINLYNNH